MYRDCEDLLAGRRRQGFERIRGGRPGGVNLDDAVVTARSELMSVAASWSGLVVDQRGTTSRPGRDISRLSQFLLTHLGWLVQHPAAGDALSEFRQAAQLAETALEPDRTRCLELGACGEPDCTGQVYASGQRVGCDQGHLFEPRQWLLLSHQVGPAAR